MVLADDELRLAGTAGEWGAVGADLVAPPDELDQPRARNVAGGGTGSPTAVASLLAARSCRRYSSPNACSNTMA